MICVGTNPEQHDYEPIRLSMTKSGRAILAICRKCGKIV